MNPKEKAQELVNSFYNNAESRNKIGAFDKDLHQHNCKQCALMAVDEILFEFAKNEELYHKLRFWLEVKIEIEAL
jgi:hypothetical protein